MLLRLRQESNENRVCCMHERQEVRDSERCIQRFLKPTSTESGGSTQTEVVSSSSTWTFGTRENLLWHASTDGYDPQAKGMAQAHVGFLAREAATTGWSSQCAVGRGHHIRQ